ncbi:thioesterase-like superfamily-domain-containing protein [Mycena epipterygia]|nr:thioesterase-like superfamily-domain-containing protein [Mycena epipterygia]
MAPFTRAIHVQLQRRDGSLTCYSAAADPEWVVGRVPHGGYILSLLIQACLQSQADSPHPDPLHVSAHYLQPTKTSSLEVQIRVLKRGRSFVNILAELVQQNRTCITAHLIFGSIPPSTRPLIDLASGYARRHPLAGHPSKVVATNVTEFFGFRKHLRWAEDPFLLSQNEPDSPARKVTTGGGVAVWGAWIELVDKDERLTPASLALFADCVHNFATLLPGSITGLDLKNAWLPTLALNVEYKAPIPAHSAPRTIGVYVISGFVSEPQGRHNTFIEMWSAPSGIGEGAEVDGWRDSMVCLAIAAQTQLMVSGSVNEKAAAKL